MIKKINIYNFKYKTLTLLIVFFLCLPSCSIKSLRVISKAELNHFETNQSINFQRSLGLIVVPIEIEGQMYRFIYDTGAQTTIISTRLSEKLNLKRKGSLPVRDSHHSTERLNVGILKTMRLGDVEYSNVGVVVNNFRNNLQFSCLDIDGIIGMNVIQLNNWIIDYEKSKITVLNNKLKTPFEGLTPLHFRLKRGTPYVKLYINGEREEFLLDIGKNGTALSVSSRVDLKGYENKLIGYSSFGMYGKTKFDTVRYAQVEISDGAHFFKEKVIVSQASRSNFVIGTGYLEKYYATIILDFKKDVLYLKERTDEPNQILNYPFTAMLLPNAIIVGSRESDYTALNIGDTILTVNNLRYNRNGCELLNEIRNSRNREQEKLSISILRNQVKKDLVIPIKSILEKEQR